VGISKQQALDMLKSDDLIGIGMEANQLRMKKNDPRIATYQIDRNINYTNFCTEYCSFCAFYRPLGAKDGYVLSFETIYGKIDEMLELGGTGVLLQGGLHPDLQIGYYENLLRSLRSRYPQVHLHCFSAPEILCIAEVSELSVHHRHNDVRLWRGAAPPCESFRTHPPDPGRDRRLYGVYSLDIRGGKYCSGEKGAGNHRGGLPEDIGGEPLVSRQHRSHSIQLADAGNQGLPDRLAIRRRRRR
jgi:Radical SAM superfamily